MQLEGARVHRSGRDVTLVTYGASLWRCVAAAEELAAKAKAHVTTLMEQGRSRWQTLAELGERFTSVERELAALTATPSSPAPTRAAESVADGMAELEQAWCRFEAQQELEALRRRNHS